LHRSREYLDTFILKYFIETVLFVNKSHFFLFYFPKMKKRRKKNHTPEADENSGYYF
jgi:hypothetical protein